MDKDEFVWRWSECKTERNGCRYWTGRLDKDGYAMVDYHRNAKGLLQPTRVARLLYELKVGPIPEGKVIKHKCDKPHCVEWTHLELGTYGENNKEGYDRGRHTPTDNRGAKNPNSKLTESNVLDIALSKKTALELAVEYGVSIWAIERIWQGKSWKHLNIPVRRHVPEGMNRR